MVVVGDQCGCSEEGGRWMKEVERLKRGMRGGVFDEREP